MDLLPLDRNRRKKVIAALIAHHMQMVHAYVYVYTLITCILAIQMRLSSETGYDEEDEFEDEESSSDMQSEEHVMDVEHLEDRNVHINDDSSEDINGSFHYLQATFGASLSQVSSQASSASSSTSKRKRVDEAVAASLIDKLEDVGDFMQQSRADFRELIDCLKVENDIQEKRSKVFEEVNKCSSLDLTQKVKVARKIVKDPGYLEVFSSLPPDAKETLYHTLLTGG